VIVTALATFGPFAAFPSRFGDDHFQLSTFNFQLLTPYVHFKGWGQVGARGLGAGPAGPAEQPEQGGGMGPGRGEAWCSQAPPGSLKHDFERKGSPKYLASQN
jgi:hypothetical protein